MYETIICRRDARDDLTVRIPLTIEERRFFEAFIARELFTKGRYLRKILLRAMRNEGSGGAVDV